GCAQLCRQGLRQWSPSAPLDEAAGPQPADVTVQRVDRIDNLVEHAERTEYLGDVAETDGRVAGLDLAQGIACDVRALGHLLRRQAQDHAPAADMPAQGGELPVDLVPSHDPRFL